MSKSSIKKNILVQTIYQVLIVLTPLITSPYISRVLGSKGLGIYSYTYSISNYFAIFAMLGTLTYGSKAIAKVRDSIENRSRVFSEIISLQMILTILGTVLYFILIVCFQSENREVAWIQSLMIVACFFNVSWFFFGMELFPITVTRNIIIKIMQILGVFLFVKTKTDLWKYVFVIAGGEVLSQGILFMAIRKYIIPKKPTLPGIIRHIRPNLVLFIPGIAFAINQDLDKTMIGIFSNFNDGGYYYNAEKLIKIPTGIISGIGVVLLPYITNSISTVKGIDKGSFVRRFIYPIFLLATALAFGIASIGEEFVPFFFGAGYEPCVELIYIMAGAMVFKALADAIRTQYLIPVDKEREYSIVVIIGACANFIINLFLIRKYGALGAAVATLIAEVIVCIGYIFITQHDIHLLSDILKCCFFFIPGIIMFMSVRILSNLLNVSLIISIPTEIFIGGIVYILIAVPLFYVLNRDIFIQTFSGIIGFIVRIQKKLL